MSDSRGWCASALVLIAACSFPEYAVAPLTTPDCANGVRDGEEEGPDCGGACAACPLCSDGRRNGDETGVDCGGSCEPCATCDDGTQNGSESDEDCGGLCSQRCDTDQRCRENADCQSLVCASVCQPSDCRDKVRNGLETGVDCGGGCDGCGNGSACEVDSDCQSSRCQSAICVAAGCTDEIVNGRETDTDCGGDECAPCMAPGKCKLARDCTSLVCAAGMCAAPSCTDKIENQDESSADCGGSCEPCAVGDGCTKAADCASGFCLRDTCVPEGPSGQPLSRGGWTLTSSEGATESGNAKAFDGDESTYWTSGVTQRSDMYVDLDLGKQRIFFTALLKVVTQPQNQDLPGYIDVYVSTDGNFGEPAKRHVRGDEWLWVNFGSAQVGRYVRFQITDPLSRAWSIGEITVLD
jgi:F5/8 type C domain